MPKKNTLSDRNETAAVRFVFPFANDERDNDAVCIFLMS
jgi:hypothetical protein